MVSIDKEKMNKRKEEIKERKHKDKVWKEAVKMRDECMCNICGATKYVQAHHIIPKEVKEFRWKLVNGISLCAKHHKYSFEISAHRNSFAFILWLMKNRSIIFTELKGGIEQDGS